MTATKLTRIDSVSKSQKSMEEPTCTTGGKCNVIGSPTNRNILSIWRHMSRLQDNVGRGIDNLKGPNAV